MWVSSLEGYQGQGRGYYTGVWATIGGYPPRDGYLYTPHTPTYTPCPPYTAPWGRYRILGSDGHREGGMGGQ